MYHVGLDPPADVQWEDCGTGAGRQRVRWAATHDREALYVVVAGEAPPRSTPVSSVLVKVEPRRLWPTRQFLFVPGAEPRAALPDSLARPASRTPTICM